MEEILTAEEKAQLEFIEDKIRRIEDEREKLIESAQLRLLSEFDALKDKIVCVIGGKGGLGSIFLEIFAGTHSTRLAFAIDQDNAHLAPELLPHADLVIFAVPIHQTPELIAHYCQWIKPTAGICDITSIKTPAVEAMLAHHEGPVMGLHPMFGIATPSLNKQLIITCPGRDAAYFAPYIQLWKILGARIVETTAAKHDKIMTHMQAVRHFNTYLQGRFTAEQGFTLQELTDLSSPIYGLELIMIGRLFAQNPELYADIIYDNPESKEAMKKYLATASQAIAQLQEDNKADFIENFGKTAEFFGDKADLFLYQSSLILQEAIKLKEIDDNRD
ncbi:bifunctional chorismate mutase/prephenate dehydrogenase [Psittacicella hinzii]|uniref:Bifunctional chorismate mutase/prephenate dehydrogenase n=1 Tax=Psittacicella hinzii TaxID=2028575 RepID=A0A3A1Y239_9GAMM|nr:bifunctional chorismate mutase/prephenate dehydrogenase [Psittacicella hinzii]RIY31288.1 bifunctional chorismate mutase/prephenate dehydrogenase [Psittacicella hinzii]